MLLCILKIRQFRVESKAFTSKNVASDILELNKVSLECI